MGGFDDTLAELGEIGRENRRLADIETRLTAFMRELLSELDGIIQQRGQLLERLDVLQQRNRKYLREIDNGGLS